MNPSPFPQPRLLRRVALAAPLLASVVVVALAAPPTPAPPATPDPAAPKDHVLFVGTELAVKQGGKYYPVVGATANSFEIDREQSVQTVKNIREVKIQVSRGVKLSNRSAEISGMKVEAVDRAAEREKFEAMKSAMQMDNVAADGTDLLQGGIISAGAVGIAYDPNSPSTPRGVKETYEAIQANKAAAVDSYVHGVNGLDTLSAAATNQLNNPVTANPTAVEVSFDVSSAEPLEHAYVVVVANYGAGTAGARQVAVQPLDRIDRQPRRVRLSHVMAVAGFEFQNFDIGLYADGEEIATNLSAKRVDLTADEAYQVFLSHYLAENAKATRAPAAMLMKPRTVFRRQIARDEVNRPIHANVDKSGALVRISVDEVGADRAPPAIETAMRSVRFVPALRNGTPVDGQVTFTLAELAN